MGTLLWAGGCVASVVDDQQVEIGAVVVTQWNDSTELFLEYPYLVAGEATGNWAIHLSDMEDFQPVRSGSLTVRFENATGTAETFEIDAPARDGIFLLDPVVRQPGNYQVELTLNGTAVASLARSLGGRNESGSFTR